MGLILSQGAVAASGLRIGDKKFISIGGIPGECLRGRKGAGGCTVKKTNTAMVIGIYDEGVQGGDCNIIVENLGDYSHQYFLSIPIRIHQLYLV